MRSVSLLLAAVAFVAASSVISAQMTPGPGPYKVLRTAHVGGAGGFDYVFADSDGRRLYIPRSGAGGRVTVFDLDTLQPAGEIPNANGVHGATVDPKSGHGFSSSNPVLMWDTKTLATIKEIRVQGSPDGILFEPATEHVYVLSHNAPNVTVINASDGVIVGTIDLGGAPEQGASDGQGHVYIDIEDKNNVAVVDAKTLKVTAHYDLGADGGTPAGLALDSKNHILFACCRNPQNVVILSADDGKIITKLPIGNGVDAATFNPNTMEAFSSHRDGTLTVIKENSPTSFAVEQTVRTLQGAKTHTLDSKTGQIYLIATDPSAMTQPATASQAAPATQDGGGRGGRGGRGRGPAGVFTIQVVGK